MHGAYLCLEKAKKKKNVCEVMINHLLKKG